MSLVALLGEFFASLTLISISGYVLTGQLERLGARLHFTLRRFRGDGGRVGPLGPAAHYPAIALLHAPGADARVLSELYELCRILRGQYQTSSTIDVDDRR